jgi:hypothetical protein
VGVDSEEMSACGITASDDEVGTNVSLITEEMLLQHGHACHDARFATGGEGVEFEVGGDEGGGEFGIGGSTGTCTPNLRGDEMQLFTILWSMVSTCS